MTATERELKERTAKRLSRLQRGMTLAFAALAGLSVLAYFVAAGTVSGRSDQMSNQTAGAASSHLISYTGASPLTAGKKVEIYFREDKGAFSVSGPTVTLADLDFRDEVGGVERQRQVRTVSLLAPDCSGWSGPNDLAAYIDDAAGRISFQACSGFESSDAGARFRIAIGAASGKSGAANRIVNPPAAGSYRILITDAAGDCTLPGELCNIDNFVVDSGSVVITASVPEICGNGTCGPGENSGNCPADCPSGGGGDPPPPADTAPPTVMNLRCDDSLATKSSVTVKFETDEHSTAHVRYGLTEAYGQTYDGFEFLLAHAFAPTGLQEATAYHFSVSAKDPSGNSSGWSADLTCWTKDETAPVISGVACVPAAYGLTINWLTNEPADSLVEYGLTEDYGLGSAADPARVLEHDQAVAGLNSDTLYHYLITSTDAAGHSGLHAGSCRTGLPAIRNVEVREITRLSAVIYWETDELADSRVDYGLTGVYGLSAANGVRVLSREIPLSGLQPDTEYLFKVTSVDATGTVLTADGFSFRTLPPIPAPLIAASPGDTVVQLTWQNPAHGDWARTVVVRTLGGPASGPTDGTVIFDGQGSAYLDTGLQNGTEYFYTAFAFSADGVPSAPAWVSAVPEAEAEPEPVQCVDTDNGRFYEVFGTATDESGAYADYCLNSETLREYYCGLEPNVALSEDYACGAGMFCSAGRCVPEVVPPPGVVCGDGVCEEPENPDVCPADCPLTPVEPPPVGPGEEEPEPPLPPPMERLLPSDLVYLATSARMPLQRGPDGSVQAYSGMSVTVVIPDSIPRQPESFAEVVLGGQSYPMAAGPDGLEALLALPNALGDIVATVRIHYADGTVDAIPAVFRLVSPGTVYEVKEGESLPVSGAAVTLLYAVGGEYRPWPAGAYGQENPRTTGAAGSFRFIVPPGTYRLEVAAEGYGAYRSLPFPIAHENVITGRIRPIEERSIREILDSDATPAEKAAEIASAVADRAIAVGLAVREAANNPFVEEGARQVAAPVATAVALANVVAIGTVTAAGIPYLLYLLSLLAHPFLLFARRRRKQWGTVYNSLSKIPVDLAIVRLTDAETGRVVRSAVTDRDGRYIFIVEAGKYRIAVAKAGFAFPTAHLRGQKEDGQFLDLYHDEMISVADDDSAITANIPIDPLVAEKTTRQMRFGKLGRRLQKGMSVLSLAVMAVVTYISPSIFMYVLLGANVISFLLFRRLAKAKKPKSWGIVYDKETGKPLRNAMARIFDSRFNKLLESQVTDAKGRYSFLVGRNSYVVTFNKPGYRKEERGPVDLTDEKMTAGALSIDAALVRADGPAREEPPAFHGLPPEPPSETPPAGGEEAAGPAEPRELPRTAPVRPAEADGGNPPDAGPAQEKAQTEPKIPWELEMLQKMKEKGPEGGNGETNQ